MKKQTLTIIDADSIIWVVGWKYKDQKTAPMLEKSVDKFITSILNKTNADSYIGFFGSNKKDKKQNFRKTIYPDYKSNRKETPDWFKLWAPKIIKRFEDRWHMIPVEGIEADDAVSIAATKYADRFDIVVASADKDLRTIPNITFFDFKNNKSQQIDGLKAAKNLAEQVLKGDSADNIKGLYKVGRIKAAKLVENCTSIYSLFRTVCTAYIKQNEVLAQQYFNKYKNSEIDKIKLTQWAINKSPAQIKRKAMIALDDKIEEYISDKMPGGWKSWITINYRLLKLLTEASDDFTVPTPTEYEKVGKISADFLYEDI